MRCLRVFSVQGRRSKITDSYEATIFQRECDGRWIGRFQIGIDSATAAPTLKTIDGRTEIELLSNLAVEMECGITELVILPLDDEQLDERAKRD